jgi:hypothetical protein
LSTPIVTRQDIVNTLVDALEPLEYVYAMWEGGAAGFKRVDSWSDLDLQIDASDEYSEDVFAIIEQALVMLSPIELKYELPQPTWHGHAQTFYRLAKTSPFLFLDLVVMNHSNPDKLLQTEIHGKPIIYFDKRNVVQSPPLDHQTLTMTLQTRLAALPVTFDLFQVLTLKELNRHNYIEAISFYHSDTLRPLVELLRIKHNPIHYNFNTRYLYYELPPEVVKMIEPLYFVASGEDLRVKRERAEQLFYQTLAEIDTEPSSKDNGKNNTSSK